MKNTKYKVVFTDKALNMLKYHIQYISLFQPDKAVEIKNKIINKAKELEIFPKRNPLFNTEINNDYRKLIIDSKYVFLYKIINNIVYIELFIDCRQENGWLLK